MEICFLLSHNYKKFVYFQKNIVDMKTKYIKDYLVEIVKESVLEPNDTKLTVSFLQRSYLILERVKHLLKVIIVSDWVLITPLNHNPAIFSVPPHTEKLNKSPEADKKALSIPICCTCFAITLMLISNSQQRSLNSQLYHSNNLKEPKCHKSKLYKML